MGSGRGPSPARGAALLVLSLLACGGGPRLSNLRCRGGAGATASPSSCQDAEDPFKLHLAVDFVDSSGTLGGGPGSTGHGGALELRLNGNTQSTLALANLFAAQQPPLDPSATQGTLQFDDEVVLDRVTQAEAFQVSLLAHDGAGATSNEPGLSFTLKLGTLLFLKEGER